MLRTFRRWCAIAAFVVTWIYFASSGPQPKVVQHSPLASSLDFNHPARTIYGLAVVAPCDVGVLLGIERALLATNVTITEITLQCREDEIKVFTSFVNQVFATSSALVQVALVDPILPFELSLLVAASQSSQSIILILNSDPLPQEQSMLWVDEAIQRVIALSLPTGPCGWRLSHAVDQPFPYLVNSGQAAFLYPPFLVSRQQVYDAINGLPITTSVWPAFGAHMARFQSSPTGGSVVPSSGCSCPTMPVERLEIRKPSPETQTFLALLTSPDHLLDFQNTCCKIFAQGHSAKVIIFTESLNEPLQGWIRGHSCYLRYERLRRPREAMSSVMALGVHNSTSPTIIFMSSDLASSFPLVYSLIQSVLPSHTISIPLTRFELKHSLWMTLLTAPQWKNWNRIVLDLSVITNNRPQSLDRLLRSLDVALPFGRSNIHLTIYMEQTADRETKKIAETFDWRHGRVTIRHRVVKGGLIPAIVESWYPTTNDNYGLILEDDIEVSPMYFAWVQMTILRYRYEESLSRLQLFGISLYQPKNVELRPEGRRPWSPHELFSDEGLLFPRTPYLSAIPCSWGAVYFPEHWREFHDYLINRISEQYVPQNHIIVPDVRSNRWQKSWKRYFIELAYLRGYVMLYPNYDGFVSFSTNHVEIGAHVSAAKARVKGLFIVPLMSLDESTALVSQLPAGELPALEDLPVVDLHGYISSMDELMAQGESRRIELCGYENTPGNFNASELLCAA